MIYPALPAWFLGLKFALVGLIVGGAGSAWLGIRGPIPNRKRYDRRRYLIVGIVLLAIGVAGEFVLPEVASWAGVLTD
jgi:hypothetical protein